MKRGKKYKNALTKYDTSKKYELGKALDIVKSIKYASFDETIELHVSLKLGKGQTMRDTFVLPNQFRGEKKVLVFCTDDKVKTALDAGATYAGSTEYIDKIKSGWLDFDIAVATPDMMKDVGRLGMVLGRKGLMPNPKSGTVTFEVAKAVSEIKAGKVEYRVDKTSIINVPIGKKSFGKEKLIENFKALMGAVVKAKPSASKGKYLKTVAISATMGPGIKLNGQKLMDLS